MRLLFFFLLVTSFIACNNQKQASVLNPGVLPSQSIKINSARDTVVKTANGALLDIKAGSFSGGGEEVELEIKEAYSFEDILKGGLLTVSNEQPLRSGGMIYINAVNSNIDITKPIRVSLPTDNYDGEMMLYKGEEEDGVINWADPQKLSDSVPVYIQEGQVLFNGNCATCHGLDKPLTGPALFGVEKRGPWVERKNLFQFTRHAGGYIPLSRYTQCLTAQYNGQMIPSFPQLSDQDLAAIYDYIKYEEGKRSLSFYRDPCADSCNRYDSALIVLNSQRMNREKLIEDNGPMTQVDYKGINLLVNDSGNSGNPQPEQRDWVSMEDNRAMYYQFSIDAFGWYNVDALLKEDERLKPSVLTVKLEGEQRTHVDIYLAVPSMKVFTKAGRTNNADEFAFDTKDGKLPLPQGEKAYIFAMSENANGILFEYKEFTTSLSQNLAIEVRPSSKDQVYSLFKSLNFQDVAVNIKDSQNAMEIRKLDNEVKSFEDSAEKLKPKNCDCFCSSDTTYIVSNSTFF